MNVLLTCAGRRNYLVRIFKDALGGRGRVLACDSSDSAPAFAEADARFVVPPLDHPGYFDTLAGICRDQRVGLLLSVHDLELEGLAQRAAQMREDGTIAVISALRVVALCQDKWAAFHWMRAHDIPTPDTYLTLDDARRAVSQGVIRYPLFIKPRWGVGSIAAEHVDNEHELALAREWGRILVQRSFLARMNRADPENCFVIQERLGGKEYGLDVVNDLDGRYCCTFARRKLVMRAGNTDRAVTVAEPALERLGKAISQRLGHIGSLDCDVIETDRGVFVLDLNPRLGGGYPFSHLAGANLPAALIAWASGEQPDPSWLQTRPGVQACKYDGMVVVEDVRRERVEATRSVR